MTGAAVAAFAAAGDLDATFGTGGVVRSAGNQAFDAVVQADGNVVVAGTLPENVPQGTSVPWTLRRYDAAGALDTTFGSGGTVSLFGTNGAWDSAMDLTIDSVGEILVAGRVRTLVTSGSGKKATTSTVDLATVARLLLDGALDTSFGSGGWTSIAVPSTDASYARVIQTQPDGKLLVGGTAYYTGTGHSSLQEPFVARLNANGSLDTSFGSGGFAFGSGSSMGSVWSIAPQSDGRIVVLSSYSTSASYFNTRITRYLPNGALDTSFATIQPADQIDRLAVDSSDRIVAVGKRTVSGGSDMLVIRYAAGGAIDATFAGGLGATVDYAAQDEATTGPFLQTDGRIVFSGNCTPASGPTVLMTARLNSDGTRDTTFGTNGVAAAVSPGTGSNFANGGSIGPDGKTVICGGTYDRVGNTNTNFDWLVVRYLGN